MRGEIPPQYRVIWQIIKFGELLYPPPSPIRAIFSVRRCMIILKRHKDAATVYKKHIFSHPMHYKCSAVAETGDILATMGMGWINMGPVLGGSWIPMQCKVAWAEVYLRTKWHLDPSCRLATINMGRKVGMCPLLGGQLGPNTMWPWPKPTSIASGILIHPAVWPK